MELSDCVAPLVTFVTIPIGVVLLLPSVMCWDAPKPKLYMKLLGYSGLSIIPTSVVAITIHLATGGIMPLALNIVPYMGIATAFAIGSLVEKNESEQECNQL
jgi:hypothetical protein